MRTPSSKILDVLEDVNDHAGRLSQAHAESVKAIESMARDTMEEISVTLSALRESARSVRDAADAHAHAATTVTDVITAAILGLAIGCVVVYGTQAVRDVARRFFG